MSGMRRNAAMMQRRIFLTILAASALLAGCGTEADNRQARPEVVQGLRLQKVQLQTVPDELEAPGSVIAAATAQVAARTMGTVIVVAAKEGDTVKRGQLLAQLDERELAAHYNAALAAAQSADAGVGQATKAVAAAQAQADVAQKTYDRYVYLKEQKSVSPQEFDEVAAKQQAAQAALEQAKAGLRQAQSGKEQAQSEVRAAESVASYARVVAPFDGRVVRRTVEPGSLVSPGTALFVVEDASRYQLEVTLPTESLGSVRKGSVARVQLDSLRERTAPGGGPYMKSIAGKTAEVEAGADPSSHTVRARIDLPHEAGIQSGVFGRAFFVRGEKKGLVVPKEGVVRRGQLQGIYTVDASGLVHWRVLTLGKEIGNQVEVLSGLAEGDVVVLNPGVQELDGKKATGSASGGEKHS
jgi:multidrug efflux pump subunit AcrA (membrane-fusion protein)